MSAIKPNYMKGIVFMKSDKAADWAEPKNYIFI